MSTTATATETRKKPIIITSDRGVRGLKPKAAQYEALDPKTPGLTLRMLPSGAKRWSYRFRHGRPALEC
jgi:hypothetical protein